MISKKSLFLFRSKTKMLQKKSEYIFFLMLGALQKCYLIRGEGDKGTLKTDPCEDKKHFYKYLQFSFYRILYKP